MATISAERLMEEGERMRRIPGIVFADGTFGRVPRISGTGIEVFEVIKIYESVSRSWERLLVALDWLSPDQVRAALNYAEAYQDEVAERLAMEPDMGPWPPPPA